MTKPVFALSATLASAVALVAGSAAALSPTVDVGGILRMVTANDTKAMDITEDLSTEVAYRLAGSPGEARARDWAVTRLRAEGFPRVTVQPFTITYWGRLWERVSVVGEHAQPLVARAIGGSPGTPEGGLEAEVVRFENLDALRAAPVGSLTGKIAYVGDVMQVARDGSGYGPAVAKRRDCAPLAAERGAVACVIRSAGTSLNHAHVGQGRRGELAPIPAAVLSNAASNQLERLLARGPVRLKLDIGVETRADAPSGNVIAEIPGTMRPNEIVVFACHLDTWDVAPGASDDAFGCGVVTSAVLTVFRTIGPPQRTVRVIWFGAEEVGVIGGRVYADSVRDSIETHVFAGESDSGSGPVFRLDTRFGPGATEGVAARMFRDLAPLGVEAGTNTGSAGPDIVPLQNLGVPIVDPVQDMTNYFSIHHTPDDVLEQIDIAHVRQNVAVWSVMAWYAGWTDMQFR